MPNSSSSSSTSFVTKDVDESQMSSNVELIIIIDIYCKRTTIFDIIQGRSIAVIQEVDASAPAEISLLTLHWNHKFKTQCSWVLHFEKHCMSNLSSRCTFPCLYVLRECLKPMYNVSWPSAVLSTSYQSGMTSLSCCDAAHISF